MGGTSPKALIDEDSKSQNNDPGLNLLDKATLLLIPNTMAPVLIAEGIRENSIQKTKDVINLIRNIRKWMLKLGYNYDDIISIYEIYYHPKPEGLPEPDKEIFKNNTRITTLDLAICYNREILIDEVLANVYDIMPNHLILAAKNGPNRTFKKMVDRCHVPQVWEMVARSQYYPSPHGNDFEYYTRKTGNIHGELKEHLFEAQIAKDERKYNEREYVLLRYAFCINDKELITCLIETIVKSEKLSKKEISHQLAIHLLDAIHYGNGTGVKYLLASGADIWFKTLQGQTIMGFATQQLEILTNGLANLKLYTKDYDSINDRIKDLKKVIKILKKHEMKCNDDIFEKYMVLNNLLEQDPVIPLEIGEQIVYNLMSENMPDEYRVQFIQKAEGMLGTAESIKSAKSDQGTQHPLNKLKQ